MANPSPMSADSSFPPMRANDERATTDPRNPHLHTIVCRTMREAVSAFSISGAAVLFRVAIMFIPGKVHTHYPGA